MSEQNNYYEFFGYHLDLSRIVAIAKPYVIQHDFCRPPVLYMPILPLNASFLTELKIDFLESELKNNGGYYDALNYFGDTVPVIGNPSCPINGLKIEIRVQNHINDFINNWKKVINLPTAP